MRFNKQELAALATQPSHNFDKEGVIIFKERVDGFFRRTEVCVPRWFKLRGNILFYFRSEEQWSEPMGLIVLENHSVQIQNEDEKGFWNFQIVFEGSTVYKMAMQSKSERDSLISYIQKASSKNVKSQLALLRKNVHENKSCIYINSWRIEKKIELDLNEVPLCELSLSCDNLLCYPHGRLPSPMITIHVKIPGGPWIEYANTEVVESCSNPTFLKTIMFRGSDGLTGDSVIKIIVYDVIERVSHSIVPLGFTHILLNTIQDTQRLRTALGGHNNSTAGFVTLSGWRLEPSSTNTSPTHIAGPPSINVPQKLFCHKRSHSLPPRLGIKLKLPFHGNIIKHNFANSYQVSYRFHSGLGGDITVHEIMSESKLCFQLPIQLLNIYIRREMELFNEILSIGELNGKWKHRQIELLNTHMYLIKYYHHASQSMQKFVHTQNGRHYKKSSLRETASLEFAPVNLHLQRIWTYNDTLNKCGFHDIITIGAFTAHTHTAGRSGGLLRLVQQMKDANTKASLHSPAANRVQSACDAVQAIKQLRKEIYDIMKKLLSLAKMKESCGMIPLAEEMVSRTRTLLTVWDSSLVEEALNFIEWHKVQPVSETTNTGTTSSPQANFQQKLFSQQSNLLEFCKQDFMTHNKPRFKKISTSIIDLTGLFPTTPVENTDKSFGAVASENTSESELKFYNQHFEEVSNQQEPSDSNENSLSYIDFSEDGSIINNMLCSNNCQRDRESDEKVQNEDDKADQWNIDFCDECNFSNCYQSSDEPEPWDLTQLNIEASVMCLVSKVKFLCGRCGSPVVRLRHQNTAAGSGMKLQKKNQEVDSEKTSAEGQSNVNLKSSLADTDNALVEAVDSVKKLVKKGNKFTDGLQLDQVSDWSVELQPSMRKLKQAMDGLLKTGRLTHSVLRLKCEHPHRTRALTALQMRRDTCFSQALTSVTTGLMTWLWTVDEDFIVTLLNANLTPLCCFEGLLSLYDNEIAMFGDMVVAIEDLQTVLFTLVKNNPSTNLIPQVTGTRCTLNILIPVSDTLYAKITKKECLSFTITAVFFNIGINEKATIAEQAGDTLAQEQSNCDNYDKINKYYHKYRKTFPTDPTLINRSSSRNKPLEEIIENLQVIVQKRISKNFDVLHLAAQATRLMNGIRLTSCKSGKDRTGMSATLEQCNILGSEYHLAEHEFSKALDTLRSEGCRRENTIKNTGVRKYAFNKLQIAALPKYYRPPPGTYGSTHT